MEGLKSEDECLWCKYGFYCGAVANVDEPITTIDSDLACPALNFCYDRNPTIASRLPITDDVLVDDTTDGSEPGDC